MCCAPLKKLKNLFRTIFILVPFVCLTSSTLASPFETKLSQAIQHQNLHDALQILETSDRLMDLKAPLPGTPHNLLTGAIALKQNELLKALVSHLIQHYQERQISLDDYFIYNDPGATPLYVAAYSGNLEAVQLLLQLGSKVNPVRIRDLAHGTTPLYIASKLGHTAVVQALLQAGAHTEINRKRTFDGSSPLDIVSFLGHREVAQLLILAGADKDSRRVNHATPMMVAAFRGHADVVQLLIDSGADFELRFFLDGPVNALDLAIQGSHLSVVKALLNAGSEVNYADPPLEPTPLIRAVERGMIEVVALLLEAGADPNYVYLNGMTALHFAAQSGNIQIARLLVKAGIQVRPSAIRRAEEYGYFNLAAELASGNHSVALKREQDQARLARIEKRNQVRLNRIFQMSTARLKGSLADKTLDQEVCPLCLTPFFQQENGSSSFTENQKPFAMCRKGHLCCEGCVQNLDQILNQKCPNCKVPLLPKDMRRPLPSEQLLEVITSSLES